jgi:hypothetical protein
MDAAGRPGPDGDERGGLRGGGLLAAARLARAVPRQMCGAGSVFDDPDEWQREPRSTSKSCL